MKTPFKLDAQALYTACDPGQFAFDTTAALEETSDIVGQPRAVEAIRFGVGIRRPGYNLFVLGPPGSGRRSISLHFIKQQAATEPTPEDLCYVNNFSDAHKPHVLRVPSGVATGLCRQMEELVEELRSAIPAIFESEEYRARQQEIESKFKERREQAFEELQKEAESHDIRVLSTPTGFVFAPTHDGEVIGTKEYGKLPEKKRKQIETVIAVLEETLQNIIQHIPRWRRDMMQEIKQLTREAVTATVSQLVDELREQYRAYDQVLSYLEEVQQDVVEHADDFRRSEETEVALLQFASKKQPTFQRYKVNVLVDHSGNAGAPVVYTDNPSYHNLVGRVEHEAHLGALVTDFTMIKPGSLHQANGGYLILDARKLLLQPYAWEGMKRALESGEIRIESLGQALSLISTVSLEPEAVPLNIKVVLLGERLLYYLLCEFDSDFPELFKVAADFSTTMVRDPEANEHYARLIGMLARQEALRPLDRFAVARVIDYSARLIEDAKKLSTRFGKIADILREADYWAGVAKNKVITVDDVQRAIDARDYRHGRVRERLLESVERNVLLIDTDGNAVGQVNGLSVIDTGDYAVGHPSRITARVRVGKGEVVDIEREIELGGPIHSKGVLILAGYLSGRYAPDHALSLSASLVFEQTYGGVEGDSASSAELYALLSSLAEVPIKQSLAATGSVNQHGQIQPVGGINEKIEGFFDACSIRGLTGEQGVLIPVTNVQHLMLRRDVIDAVSAGQFHIYAVETIDQGLEIITGQPAGERDEQGNYPDGSINARVEARLLAMAQYAHAREEEENDGDAA